MSAFLYAAAAFLLVMVGLGLWRLLRGPTSADRLMAAQLSGTGLAAATLLLASAAGAAGAVDVALTLALLAALAAAALGLRAPSVAGDGGSEPS